MRRHKMAMLPVLLLCCAVFGLAQSSGLTISPASLPNGQVGVAYVQQLTATGNVGTVTWSLSTGNLPQGFVLTTSGVVCVGTFNGNVNVCNGGAAVAAGVFPFQVRAQDSSSDAFGLMNYSITILQAGNPVITTASPLPNAGVGQAYSITFAVSGGTAPYQWFEFTSFNTFPPGFVLDPSTGVFCTGVLVNNSALCDGTVATSGTYTFGVEVRDNNGLQSSPRQYSLTIGQGLTITNTSPLPSGAVGAYYNSSGLQLIATEGSGSYSWSLTSGALPSGLSLSTGGLIYGTPTFAEQSQFTVQVTDIGSTSTTFEAFTSKTFLLSVVSNQQNITVSNSSGTNVTSLTFSVPAGASQTSAVAQQIVTVIPSTGPATLSLTLQSRVPGCT